MPRTVSPLLPSTDERLRQFGERLRLARLRRRLSAKHVAARAGMAPMTLRSVERGGAGVTMGAYLAVMQVLGVETDLDLLAQADPMGRALQDARLSTQGRDLPEVPARQAQESTSEPPKKPRDARAPIGKMRPNAIGSRDRVQNSRFTSAQALAALLEAPPDRRGRAKRH
jgi:transcriptional regulator with XRE-family HTH domain